MPTTKLPPNTIYLGGGEGQGGQFGYTPVHDLPAMGTITPGMLLEPRNDGGVSKLGIHDVADDPVAPPYIALEQLLMNLGVDDNYAAGDLVLAGIPHTGSTWWMILASGQNIANEALLQSAGNGKLKALGTGVAIFRAKESSGGVTGADTRIRVERV